MSNSMILNSYFSSRQQNSCLIHYKKRFHKKNYRSPLFFPLLMLFVFLLIIPPVSAGIPEVPPPTIDQEGTERSWDITHPGWRNWGNKQDEVENEIRREAARQLRLKRAEEAAKRKAEAKKRKQQAYAEAQRKKEEKRIEQERRKEMEARKRKEEKQRKAKALDMMKRYRQATAEVNTPASTYSNADEIIYQQNNLFVELLSTDVIAPEEKMKFKLNLPTYKKQTTYKVLASKVPPMPGGFSKNYLNSDDEFPSPDSGSDMPGFENTSWFFAEVADKIKDETIEFYIGSIRNPQVAIALKGGKIVSEFNAKVLKKALTDIDNAVKLLAAQQRQLTQDFVIQREGQ